MTRKGTAVDVIEYDKDSIRFKIPLRLLKLSDGTFTYRAVHDDPTILVTNKDPNEVRRQVLEQLEKAVTIQWSEWILIECRRSSYSQSGPYGGESDYDSPNEPPVLQGGRTLGMTATRWRLGKVQGGGTVSEMAKPLQEDRPHIHRTDTSRRSGTPSGIEYEFDKFSNTGKFVADENHALIPDTESNQHKVRSILNSLDILGKSLAILMGQDRVVETLANVQLLGLPAPDSAPGMTKRKRDA